MIHLYLLGVELITSLYRTVIILSAVASLASSQRDVSLLLLNWPITNYYMKKYSFISNK